MYRGGALKYLSPAQPAVLSSMATRQLYEPAGRLYSASFSTPNHLYLWGGRTVDFETGSEDAKIQLSTCIEQFDPYLEVWGQLSTTGTPHPGLDVAVCASVGDNMYMYGGSSGTRYQGVLSLLNLKTLTWSQLCQEATAGGPMRKSGCRMVCYDGNQLVVMGGYGVPTGPNQPGASFIRDTIATDGSGWTNEVHIYIINQGRQYSYINFALVVIDFAIILLLHDLVQVSGPPLQ